MSRSAPICMYESHFLTEKYIYNTQQKPYLSDGVIIHARIAFCVTISAVKFCIFVSIRYMIAQHCISTYVPVRVCVTTSLHDVQILCLADCWKCGHRSSYVVMWLWPVVSVPLSGSGIIISTCNSMLLSHVKCGVMKGADSSLQNGSLPLLSPAFRRSQFRRQVPVRPQGRERS